MGEDAVTWTNTKHETERYEICKLPEQNTMTVPLKGSEEDRILQACELKLNPNNDNYPHDVMHVYAWNAHCEEWNEYRLKLLPGKEFTNIATDSKKDDCTELTNVSMPTNACQTGNLKKKCKL